ncbi:hypothetical protein UFOVP257_244 [uncultured Caudovirales phage]|uniref:Uncharacterized protein n=1 Tax=uncultured Caudovirales phage TaxID=2100421 RepID=A0A6J5LIY8_9CAUD|nr:hypothetical protein UFOVP257_244 [uncultured Caudovirales phage]
MIFELLAYGFFSAFGWWAANHYVIEPHFPPAIEQKKNQEPVKEKKAD